MIVIAAVLPTPSSSSYEDEDWDHDDDDHYMVIIYTKAEPGLGPYEEDQEKLVMIALPAFLFVLSSSS